MKKLFLLLFILIASGMWFKGWVSSGKMDNFIERHSRSPLAPKSLYWIGKIYTLTGNGKTAAYYQRWLIRDYPNSAGIEKIRWDVGRYYEDSGNKGLAMEQYAVLHDSYSETESGRLASTRLDRFRF